MNSAGRGGGGGTAGKEGKIHEMPGEEGEREACGWAGKIARPARGAKRTPIQRGKN